jgi:hypothetical protein
MYAVKLESEGKRGRQWNDCESFPMNIINITRSPSCSFLSVLLAGGLPE